MKTMKISDFERVCDEHDKLTEQVATLSHQLAEAQAELLMWRASFPASAEAVKRDALSNMRGT